MKRTRPAVDKVRASRDGHEYHEAWTARAALQLLRPGIALKAIAVEGLSPVDQQHSSAEASEIADLTFYYGHASFPKSVRTTITQFKYSIANEAIDFRASNAKPTIEKFAKTYLEYRKRYGAKAVREKLRFELITNRPIYKPLQQAIESVANGTAAKREVQTQATQFISASGLAKGMLAEFAATVSIIGVLDDLPATNNELASCLTDWSATTDSLAIARLGQLRKMVRDKAGHAGTNRNLIVRTDILSALHIADADDLLPSKPSIPEVGEVVEREQLASTLAMLPHLSMPLLIHASGGVGKTVFMDSLARLVGQTSEVVFFDCFGGGAYRSPEDARHQPKKALIHIANTLSFKGLCDPMLPDSCSEEVLLKTFRRRVKQCVDTLRRKGAGSELVLFIDAIDNAELVARSRSESAFPIQLLESLHHEAIQGMKLVVSCRTERKPKTHARYQELELLPFSIRETSSYLAARLKKVSVAEINVAQARSGGNARVLDYLIKTGRSLLDESEINKKLLLDDLIHKRITSSLEAAVERGYTQDDVKVFLAGLAVLPPPVPINEYAEAHKMKLSEIESFISDLSPLLERTGQGLMFRDEPTETLIRNNYASSIDSLEAVSKNLLARQDKSVYAARALPGLLHQMDDSDRLFKLAFDERIPSAITSTVGKRNIRYARIKTAVLHATIKNDCNRLVHLLVELSTLAAVDQRGSKYLHQNPDLVVTSGDADGMRRLFETRAAWQGARHARLLIANSLSGDAGEAYRHAVALDEWIEHYRRSDRDDMTNRASPELQDIAAIPFFLVCEGSIENAARFLRGWKEWYAFDVGEYLFSYLNLGIALRRVTAKKVDAFTRCLADAGSISAALAFSPISKSTQRHLITALGSVCRKAKRLDDRSAYRRGRINQLEDGLRKAAAIGLFLNQKKDALAILHSIPDSVPSLWVMRERYRHHEVFALAFRGALEAAIADREVHPRDILPSELALICAKIKKDVTDEEFRDIARDRIQKAVQKSRAEARTDQDHRKFSYEDGQYAERFINQQLLPYLRLTRALSRFLKAPASEADKAFLAILKTWEDERKRSETNRLERHEGLLEMVAFDAALFALWTRSEIKPNSVRKFLKIAHAQKVSVNFIIQIVSILAKRASLQVLAAEQALQAKPLIEREDDVAHRASLFADLARAILPASMEDASAYFRDGLEQMDAIGSGDYEFTNELLLFASAIKGEELKERDFHTLSNICELNLGEEPHKFFWGAYARGMSKACGVKGLSKLCRFEDRDKIGLDYTLLPYLTALLNDGKLGPDLALVLNGLADPVEYFDDGTKEFARSIQRHSDATPTIISELIKQFEDDNPDTSSDTTVGVLAAMAEDALGKKSDVAKRLYATQKQFETVRRIRNENSNYHGVDSRQNTVSKRNTDAANRAALARIAKSTTPTSRDSLANALSEVNKLQFIWEFKDEFFTALRKKVPVKLRGQFIRDISSNDSLNYYWKLAELRACQACWNASSASLSGVIKSLAVPLIQQHAEDLISDGRFSGYKLKEISDLTGVAIGDLILELIKVVARPEKSLPGAVWLSFATFVASEAEDGQAQLALERLLGSDAAKLANSVVDGPWRHGLYPDGTANSVACGFIWFVLGSPHAGSRWRAAHSIRRLAAFGRWDIVNLLVQKFNAKTANEFQASELKFSFLNARLWMLIALARVALDFPKEISEYKDFLLAVALEKEAPHVVMRHFACRALLSCIDAGHLRVSAKQEVLIRGSDSSPHPRLREKARKHADIYHRPKSVPEPAFDFGLDYDFHKQDVDYLSHVFGKPCWIVKDMISAITQGLDSEVSGMYDDDGRSPPGRQGYRSMGDDYHSYGQHLGWHGLFFAAGRLLRDCPVTNDWWYEEDPWGEWFGRYLLTRSDGYWLSDATDRMPLETAGILLEQEKAGLALTGDEAKLLQLVGIDKGIGKDITIEGRWHSADGIEVRVSSALVHRKDAAKLMRKLVRDVPMTVWLPTYDESESDDEHHLKSKKEYMPWVVNRSGEGRLDKHDPFGVTLANFRPYLSRKFVTELSLVKGDRFGRTWNGPGGTSVLNADAWGREERHEDRGPYPGQRLRCSKTAIKKALKKEDMDLVLLIKLQKYQKESYRGDGKYTHTVAVVRINRDLDFEYRRGAINKLHVMNRFGF